MPSASPAYNTRSPGAASNSKARFRALTWIFISALRQAGSERYVIAHAEHARVELECAPRELRRASREAHLVVVLADREQRSRAAVELGFVDLNGAHDFRFLFRFVDRDA